MAISKARSERGLNRIGVVCIDSSNPGVIQLASNYGTVILLGLLQGITVKILGVTINNGTVKVYDVLSSASSEYNLQGKYAFSFNTTTHELTISTTFTTSNSYLTYIYGDSTAT